MMLSSMFKTSPYRVEKLRRRSCQDPRCRQFGSIGQRHGGAPPSGENWCAQRGTEDEIPAAPPRLLCNDLAVPRR